MTIPAQINGQQTTVTPQGLISELTYSCYRFNRQQSPGTSPEQWAKVFGPTAVDEMEERYQRERSESLPEREQFGTTDSYGSDSEGFDNFWQEDRGPICENCGRHERAHYNYGYCYSTGRDKFKAELKSQLDWILCVYDIWRGALIDSCRSHEYLTLPFDTHYSILKQNQCRAIQVMALESLLEAA